MDDWIGYGYGRNIIFNENISSFNILFFVDTSFFNILYKQPHRKQ